MILRRTRLMMVLAAAVMAPAAPSAIAAKAGDAKATEKPFIERTYVAIPRQVGEFSAEQVKYDPRERYSGVSIRYSHPAHPQIRLDLFVYPIGKGDVEEILDAGMKGFVASMKPAVDAGYYRNFIEIDTVDFDLALQPTADVSESASAPAKGTSKSDDPEREARYAAWKAEMLESSRRVDGRRMRLRYDFKGDLPDEWFPMRSRTYLFHRQLYYFKGRISAAESQIDEAAFGDFADRAYRELVPAVMAYNIGSCGGGNIMVDTTKPVEEAADQLFKGLLGAELHLLTSNCHAKPDETIPTTSNAELEVVTIEYAPDDWKSK
jgi:hypothetical protein